MKILKPGKVEHRKFVCPQCECVFLATCTEAEDLVYVRCPQNGCRYGGIEWCDGEPYEEPMPTLTDRDRLRSLTYEWECDHASICGLEDFLIAHGVTFREG